MEELNLPNNVIYQVIDNLINEVTDKETKFKARSAETKKIIYYKNQDNLDAGIKSGHAIPFEKGDTEEPEKEDDTGKLGADDFDTEKSGYLVKKDDKKDEPTDDKPKAQSNGYSGDKDKTLEQGNPNDSEEYNRDLEPDDEAFDEKNKKDANPTPPQPLKLDGIVKNPKFPKRYLKVLERMVNTRVTTRSKKWEHFSDIEGGAGRISAQAGELMTMMGASMSDEEFEELTNVMLEHEKELIAKHKGKDGKPGIFQKMSGKKPNRKVVDNPGSRIVDKSWVMAAKNNRKAILDRIKNQYGEDAEIVSTAWDAKNEVETMGLSDYKNNKGFSTDMYIKVKKPDGEEVLDEVSLKKSTKVNFLNSSAGKFEEWDENLSDEINQTVYRNKARKRNMDFINSKMDKVKDLLNSPEGEPIRKLMKSKGLTFEQALEGGSRDRQNVLWKSIGLLSKGGDEEASSIIEQDNKEHNEFVDKSVKAITENPKMRDGMLNDIRQEFPLKAVSDGEETMAIGPNSLDKKTMKAIFGTDNYDEIKEKLVAEAGPPPFIGYNVDSSGEVFPVAEIKVREDGRGYGGQFKFEMILHKDFAPRLEKAQSEVYGETE
tara:strand:- start:20 stop:1819 length:1800 start_codon:yes stop_codon:yes gene_type:complete